MSEHNQFCTFWVGDSCLGLEVTRIQEILVDKTLTPVPLAPPLIGGLVNIRGEIGIALDMRRLLESSGTDTATSVSSTVLTLAGDERVGLLVERAGDVVEVAEDLREATPETVKGAVRELISGVYKLEDCLLLALDADRVITRAQTEVSRGGFSEVETSIVGRADKPSGEGMH